MTTQLDEKPRIDSIAAAGEPPFGVNEMRLNAMQWIAAAAIMLLCITSIPRVWNHFEKFEVGPDYRIPYAFSSDYWLYRQRLDKAMDAGSIAVVGDSVIWGEYVRSDGTLIHFLNKEAGRSDRFANCGVNGVFPLALEGLVSNYAGNLQHRKVILHCNLLWMSSPKADLSTTKEETFNHSQLVPQFSPRIPCYRADAATRLGAVAWRSSGFMGWVNHLDSVYFEQKSVPDWTLKEDGSDPPIRPNAGKNPLAQFSFQVPGEPALDPQRGPASPRHKPWNMGSAAPSHFDWVRLEESLQWKAFQHTVGLLRERGNDVFVLLGPFNEHMIAEDQRPVYQAMKGQVVEWLKSANVPFAAPGPLPSDLYADASHPLSDGYRALASEVYVDPVFQEWLGKT